MNWKQAAKHYKKMADAMLLKLLEASVEQVVYLDIVKAAIAFKKTHEKKKNPMVALMGQEAIEIERARKALFKSLEKLED